MVYRRTARSEKVRAESEARILKAARSLFAERGYEATTMQDIVRAAKTSIGNVYFYFDNKEQLLTALLEAATRQNWEYTDDIVARVKLGPARIAVAVYTNVTSLAGPTRDLVRIALATAPNVVRHITDLYAERMNKLFSENFAGHSPAEHQLMAGAVLGANRTLVERYALGRIEMPLAQMAEFLVRWHLRAMRVPEREITQSIRTAARVLAKFRQVPATQ